MVGEVCFLQIRMICELLAFACLVAHEDIKAARAPKFTNESHAATILRKLEELHADFFPRRIEVFKEGTHVILQPP